MALTSDIKEHMEVIGADGVHVGTIDKVEADQLKLTKSDPSAGGHKGHRFVPTGLIAGVEGNKVRLSATGANAFLLQSDHDAGSRSLVADRGGNASRPARSSGPKSDTNWTGIAIGTATLAAAGAAAAYFARGRKTDTQRFELQLQTDETLRLISSTKVEGTPVVGRNGEHLGRIESFMVDKYSGRVAYAVLSFGGTMGFGESLFPLPWSYLMYDVENDGYALDVTKEQLASLPTFKASDTPEFDAEYRRGLAQAYDRSAI